MADRRVKVMSNVRKHLGVVCLAALIGPACVTQLAAAEGARDAAPIVFASAGAGPVRSDRSAAPVRGPMDIRPGAHSVSFAAPSAVASMPRRSGAAPAPEGWSRPYAGPPYQVNGKWFVPMHEPDYDEVGIASWYGPGFDGELASSGETFDQDALTAAHPTLPIPSVVRVTNLENNRAVLLRLNDRGPYVDDRIIDLSRGAADALDVRRNGTAKVRVEYVGPAPVEPDAPLTERMLAQNTPSAPAAALQPAGNNVWSTPLPAAAGMPDRPASQVSDEGYDAPVEISAQRTAPAPPLAGGFAVQIGSFSDLSNAHKALGAFDGNGGGFVRSAVVDGGQFYRAMLGPWPDKAAAERTREELAKTGKSALVITLDR